MSTAFAIFWSFEEEPEIFFLFLFILEITKGVQLFDHSICCFRDFLHTKARVRLFLGNKMCRIKIKNLCVFTRGGVLENNVFLTCRNTQWEVSRYVFSLKDSKKSQVSLPVTQLINLKETLMEFLGTIRNPKGSICFFGNTFLGFYVGLTKCLQSVI